MWVFKSIIPPCFLLASYISVTSWAFEVTTESDVVAYVGGQAIMTCNSTLPSNAAYAVVWYHGTEEIIYCGTKCNERSSEGRYHLVIDRSRSTSRLEITNVGIEDSGQYTCEVSGIEGEETSGVTLSTVCMPPLPVLTCPGIVRSEETFPVTCESHYVTFSLDHSAAIDDITLTVRPNVTSSAQSQGGFYFNHTVSSGGQLDRSTDGRMYAEFTCCVHATYPCAKFVCSLSCTSEVTFPPTTPQLRWSTPETSISESSSGSLVITCEAHANPTPTLTWTLVAPQSLHTGSVVNGSRSVQLPFYPINRDASGEYVCRASNGLLPARSTNAIINVQYSPSIHKNVSEVSADEGTQSAHLSCIVDANPRALVTWSKCSDRTATVQDDVVLSETPYAVVLESTLRLVGAVTKDDMFCDYTCSAINDEGSDSHSIFLSGNTFPDAPTNLHGTDIGSDYVIFSWDATPTDDVTYVVTACWGDMQSTCTTSKEQTDTSFTLGQLRSLTQYTITVSARNHIGVSKDNPTLVVVTTMYVGPSSSVAPLASSTPAVGLAQSTQLTWLKTEEWIIYSVIGVALLAVLFAIGLMCYIFRVKRSPSPRVASVGVSPPFQLARLQSQSTILTNASPQISPISSSPNSPDQFFPMQFVIQQGQQLPLPPTPDDAMTSAKTLGRTQQDNDEEDLNDLYAVGGASAQPISPNSSVCSRRPSAQSSRWPASGARVIPSGRSASFSSNDPMSNMTAYMPMSPITQLSSGCYFTRFDTQPDNNYVN